MDVVKKIKITKNDCTTRGVGHGVFALLSAHSYNVSNGGLPGAWSVLTTSEDVIDVGSRYGYFGVAYVDRAAKKIIISHRGTELTDIYDLSADANIFSKILPTGWLPYLTPSWAEEWIPSLIQDLIGSEMKQFKPANIFFHDVLKNNPGFAIAQTGHSLGGAIAGLLACVHRTIAPAVTFESPGEYLILAGIISTGSNEAVVTDTLSNCPVISYTSSPNLINMFDSKVGEQRQINLPTITAERRSHTLYQHSMDDIAKSFRPDMHCAIDSAAVHSWPIREYIPYVSNALYNWRSDLISIQGISSYRFTPYEICEIPDVIHEEINPLASQIAIALAVVAIIAFLNDIIKFCQSSGKKNLSVPSYATDNRFTIWGNMTSRISSGAIDRSPPCLESDNDEILKDIPNDDVEVELSMV